MPHSSAAEKEDGLRPDLIEAQDDLLVEARKGCPNLAYKKTASKEMFEIIFDMKQVEWKLKRQQRPTWVATMLTRWGRICRDLRQAEAKPKPPMWLYKLKCTTAVRPVAASKVSG